jgi:methyl-accepting chemotaxis protein
MSSVYNTTEVISSGAAEIASGSDDLSQRAAQQAANLEETSTSLETISATVRNSAQLAKSAHLAVEKTKAAAELSGDIVQNAIGAMTEIETSSRKINRIIGAIDEIAFQTNLLALNAGVEAARAGEAGRGFAVIAAEVRGLSQRSAKAAAEIKSLISESHSQVARGVKLVHDTNDAFISIIGQVDEVAAAMAKIALDSQLQSVGLDQISSAVNQLDQSTQKNALVAEQSLTGARSMAKTTDQLVGALKAFKIAETKDNVIGGGRASRPVALKRKISRVS